MHEKPKRQIELHPYGATSLEELLNLTPPPFIPSNPFRQLRYIYDHVGTLGCATIVVEDHYIDRHYMEDHSIFYSKNFFPPLPNYCRRLHFFSVKPDKVQAAFYKIIEDGRKHGLSAYKRACDEFSRQAYLGFSVIKPLKGSPVGRTVVRHFGPVKDDKLRRRFKSTGRYKVHVSGCELRVTGLAFQQQDVGVSACATTALWSSLQQSRVFEKIRSATPAQITMLGTQHSLPSGKPMPSEGLSVDQMCQATQALGVPPTLIKVKEKFVDARAHLYAATESGFAPVLIIQKIGNRQVNHAVTVTGLKIDSTFDPKTVSTPNVDVANELEAIYVHDDRFGPYVMAKIRESAESLVLDIEVKGDKEEWYLTHFLIPMHPKIRISFAGIYRVANKIVAECAKELKTVVDPAQLTDFPKIVLETKIQRSIEYIEDLIYDGSSVSEDSLKELLSKFLLSRYVGIIRLRSDAFGEFDLLIDTTTTLHNLTYLGIVIRGKKQKHTDKIRQWLASQCDCESVG